MRLINLIRLRARNSEMFELETESFGNCDNNNPNASMTTKFSVKDILNMTNNDGDYNAQLVHGNYINLCREHNPAYYEDYHQYAYQNWDNCYAASTTTFDNHQNNYSYQNFYDVKTENDFNEKIECESSYVPQLPVNSFCGIELQQDCKDYIKADSPSK